MNSDDNIAQQTVIGRSDLVTRAHLVLADIEKYRDTHGVQESTKLAEERWIHGEPDGTLQHLAELLVRARQQALIQNQLNTDREALHHGRLSHEQLVTTGHHYEMLRHAACEYNHTVRSFIEGNREEVDRDHLTQWLTMASSGHEQWATGEITGAISEIALHAALMGMSELVGLRYGTLEEDLHGNDFIALWQGRIVTVDAKTGRYYPLSEQKHGHLHLEISVPREVLDGFRLTRRGLDGLRHDVRQALHESGGVMPHAAHAHFHQPSPAV